MSRGAGLCIAFDTALILLPMLRTIITMVYPKLTLLALDENIWFHRQTGYALVFFTIIHVTGFYVNFYRIEELGLRKEDAFTMLYRSWAGITGWIMCLVMFLMYTTSAKSIRIMSFETFRYTHFLYWIFFIGISPRVFVGVVVDGSAVVACCGVFCTDDADIRD
jgi:NADPH oxidase 1